MGVLVAAGRWEAGGLRTIILPKILEHQISEHVENRQFGIGRGSGIGHHAAPEKTCRPTFYGVFRRLSTGVFVESLYGRRLPLSSKR
jgi:hypothetical protein